MTASRLLGLYWSVLVGSALALAAGPAGGIAARVTARLRPRAGAAGRLIITES